MGYRKDYKTFLKDPDSRPDEPAGGKRETAPLTAEEIDDRLMGLANGAPAQAIEAEEDDGPDLPPDPEDLISHLPLERYVASGQYRLGGAIVTVVIGVIFVGILGGLYGLASAKVNVSLLNFPICLLYGFLASVVIYLSAEAGKLRSDAAVFVTAFIISLVGWYASWVVFTYVAADRGVVEGFGAGIGAVLHNQSALAGQGRALFGSAAHYGAGVTIATWLVEGLFMALFPPLLNVSIVAGTPFCEDCGKWVDAESYHFRVGPSLDLEEFRRDVIRRGPAAIAALGPPPPLGDYIEIRACVCPLCQKIGFFNTQQLKKIGSNPRPTTTNIDNNLAMRGLELRQMQQLVDRARASGQNVDPI